MATVDALKTSLNNLLQQINTLVLRKPDRSLVSDDAPLLSGVTKATLLSEAQTKATAHINNKNNPHGVTAELLGGEDKPYVDADLATRVPLNALSISQFGDTGTAALGVTTTGWTIKFTKTIQAYVQGVFKLFPIQDIVLTTINPTPANKTFYVYVKVVAGDLAYVVSTDLLGETMGTMYIGKVITGASAITSHTITDRITRIGVNRISQAAIGSAVPVTGGSPVVADKLAPAWHP